MPGCRAESSASRCPQAEQVLLLGYQRSITIRRRPARAALYWSWRRNSPQPQSDIALASDLLRTMFFTARSSITMTSWSRTSRAEVRCRKSARDARTLRCARATLALALARFAEPCWQRARRRWQRARLRSRRARRRGFAILCPSLVTAKSLMPRSTPAMAPAAGKLGGLGHLDGEGDVPAAARVAGDRHRARVERCRVDVRPGPGERQRRAHLGEEQLPVAVPEPRPGVLGALPPAAGLVAGVAGAAGEEAGERGLLMAERLLERDAGHLVQPAELRGGLQGGQVGAGLGVTGAGLIVAVAGVAPGQGAVPHRADAAERAVQHARLFEVWVGPAFVGRTHV